MKPVIYCNSTAVRSWRGLNGSNNYRRISEYDKLVREISRMSYGNDVNLL